MDDLGPIAKLIGLHIDSGLGEERKIGSLSEEDSEPCVLDLVEKVFHLGDDLGGWAGAMGEEVQDKAKDAGSFEHKIHRPCDDDKVKDEVNEVERSNENVADQRHDDTDRRNNAHPPCSTHTTTQTRSLVFQHHVPCCEEEHDAEERHCEHVGQRLHISRDDHIERDADSGEGHDGSVVRSAPLVTMLKEFGERTIKREATNQTGDTDKRRQHRTTQYEGSIKRHPQPKHLAAAEVSCLGYNVAVVGVDLWNGNNGEDDEGDNGVEHKHKHPHRLESLEKGADALLFYVVGTGLKASDAKHGG
mmetsp:Transcript_61953/g.134585  ORF Transcript_61953/g.134585 Transcript_61953/m.134585 type:complete len:303 (-) Transcript_61953:78-986(-)